MTLTISSAKVGPIGGNNVNITSTVRRRHLRSTSAVEVGPCGYGNVNDGTCPNATMCCSPTGWCLSESVYCACSQKNASEIPCGYGNIGNGTCLSDNNETGICCSVWGWCGTGPEFCINPFNQTTPISSLSKPSISKPHPTSAPSISHDNIIGGSYYPGEQYYLFLQPTPEPKRSCGNGTVGDGYCSNRELECFPDGYCRKHNY